MEIVRGIFSADILSVIVMELVSVYLFPLKKVVVLMSVILFVVVMARYVVTFKFLKDKDYNNQCLIDKAGISTFKNGTCEERKSLLKFVGQDVASSGISATIIYQLLFWLTFLITI